MFENRGHNYTGHINLSLTNSFVTLYANKQRPWIGCYIMFRACYSSWWKPWHYSKGNGWFEVGLKIYRRWFGICVMGIRNPRILETIRRYIMCDLLNQHWYESTYFNRWKATGENWVCKRCGKAIKSVKEMAGTKGKLTF